MLAGRQFNRAQGEREVPSVLVDHTYIDYSTVDLFELLQEDDARMPMLIDPDRIPFPVKLHMILSDPRNRDVVRWMPHGRSWKIFDKEGIARLCGEYLHNAAFNEFIGLVNKWGFKVRESIGCVLCLHRCVV
jgi:hypothetical protein